MFSHVAPRAKRNAVGRVVAQRCVLSPTFQMMGVQSATDFAAILARPLVPIHDGSPERLVIGGREICLSCRAGAAQPVRMGRSNEMYIAGWHTSSTPSPGADGRLVFVGERPSAQRSRDIEPLTFGNAAPRSGRLTGARGGNLRLDSRVLRRVGRAQIAANRSARTRAKLRAAASVAASALVAVSFVKLGHAVVISGGMIRC